MAEVHEPFPDGHHDTYSKTVFGFWLYIITDFMLFATMFAAFVVLRNNFFGGPSPKEMFNLTTNYVQSYILLASSFTSGIGGAMVHRRHKTGTIIFFLLTMVLGIAFCVFEFKEFSSLIEAGNSWTRSGYLSCFFSIVATFLIHILIAILWTLVLIIPVFFRGLDAPSMRRLTCMRMFWQFLNIVWVFIFSIIYLMGVI